MPTKFRVTQEQVNSDYKWNSILSEVWEERKAQIEEWGGPDIDDSNTKLDWIAYITKHVGKALTNPFNLDIFRYQMLRVAALAIAAVASVDRYKEKLSTNENVRTVKDIKD
jgi:uncharacterized protein YacL